jgi:hypothetical protein
VCAAAPFEDCEVSVALFHCCVVVTVVRPSCSVAGETVDGWGL